MQPRYAELICKQDARTENLKWYERLTGRDSLPADGQYWTLANEQPNAPGSEINQLIEAGFLSKNQFHGVDRDPSITRSNQIAHPKANWYTGEWTDVIADCPDFSPSLIYLDSTCFADSHPALQLLATTMLLTPPGTVLLFNAMNSTPYSSRRLICADALIASLPHYVAGNERRRWRKQVPSFTYTASRTEMRTYALYKEN